MSIDFESASSVYVTVGGVHKKVSKVLETVNGVWVLKYLGDEFAALLVDFEYTNNDNGTATITGWKGTYNGEPSTELVIPDDPRIIL